MSGGALGGGAFIVLRLWLYMYIYIYIYIYMTPAWDPKLDFGLLSHIMTIYDGTGIIEEEL